MSRELVHYSLGCICGEPRSESRNLPQQVPTPFTALTAMFLQQTGQCVLLTDQTIDRERSIDHAHAEVELREPTARIALTHVSGYHYQISRVAVPLRRKRDGT